MLRRQPVGVVVVTVDLEGEQLGLTVASFVSLALEPPLVGISIARQAALHELLRAAGGFGVSLLAAGQVELARHFARGVPPLVLWQGIETLPGNRAPLLAGAVGWLDCARRSPARRRRPHLLRRPRSSARRSASPARRSSASTGTTHDRRRRLRPGRRDRGQRAGVGRGARATRARARRPLDRVRAARHDGDELARVVALPARGARARGVAGGAERRGRPPDARALPRRAPAASKAQSQRSSASRPTSAWLSHRRRTDR